MVEPIKPSDLKSNNIPGFVIEVVNKLITKKWNGMESRIYVRDIISIIETNYNISQDRIYLNHWLDFEDLYEQVGWEVKCSLDDIVGTFFTFRKRL